MDLQAASSVKFHDGSAFNADAVVWNAEVLDKTQYISMPARSA
jgi:ABC-type transport system substrate-binding protein